MSIITGRGDDGETDLLFGRRIEKTSLRVEVLGAVDELSSALGLARAAGAMPEVERAVAQVRRVHRVVSGVSSRGIRYDADDPGHSAWVHNALTDSFLVANQTFGANRLTAADADLFVVEQTRVGALLDADPMPTRAGDLTAWIAGHPEIAPSSEMLDAVDFLVDPPLDDDLKLGYKLIMEAAVATIPARPVPVVVTTAAGDTFVGVLVTWLADGRPMVDALKAATVAAGIAVGRPGATGSMPRRDEFS